MKNDSPWVSLGVSQFIFLSVLIFTACSVEEPDDGGVVGTGIIFRGTVSEQKQLAENEIEIRAQSGERATTIISTDGQYVVEQAPGSGPWLLRSSLGNGNFRYGIAYPGSIAHVHSYTDVALRSWFLSQYDTNDVNATFEGEDTLPDLPTAKQFNSLADQYFRIVEFVLEDYGLRGDQLLTEPFRADDSGIDEFLDLNPVFVDGRQITVLKTDPLSRMQTSTNADILLGAKPGQDDVEPPSIPENLRALSGPSGEIVLVWEPSTDNTVVIGYDIIRDGKLIAISSYPDYTDKGATSGSPRSYEVKSIDSAGNRSAAAQISTSGTVNPNNMTALATPINLMSVVSTTQRVELLWVQETIGNVAAFNIYRGPTADSLSLLLRVSSTSVTDATISPGQEYWYAISAVDASGKESNQSVPLRVLTTGAPLEPPPLQTSNVPALAGLNVLDAELISCDAAFPVYNIDTEVTPAPGCYRVEQDIVVDNFGVLKLQPGVVLKFAAGRELLINSSGRLESEGTDDNPVVLTGERSVIGWWRGIQLNRSDDPKNIISRTVIEYHGSDSSAAGILLVSSKNAFSRLRVENSLIRFGRWYGIDMPNFDAKLDSFKGNLVTQNGRAAGTNYTSLAMLDDGSRFSNNDINRLFVTGTSYEGNIVLDDFGMPYHIGGINQETGSVVINEGVKLFFLEGEAFVVRKSLAIRGTADNPVIMTSIKETPGSWQGLQLIEGANVQISHAIIENGGEKGGKNPEGANLFADNARLSIENLTLRSSSSYGYHETGTQVKIDKADRISFFGNAREDVVDLNVR